MTRIVCISDTHNHCEGVHIPNGDVLVHAGDLTRRGTLQEVERAATWLRSLPHKHKVIIAGNHDFAFQQAPHQARQLMHGLTYLEDSGVEIEGLYFYGSPWQPWFFDWAFNLPRDGDQIKARWDDIPGHTDVLIVHGPPLGIQDLTVRGEKVGCRMQRRALSRVRPKLHVFGHIHEAYGQTTYEDTECVNASLCSLKHKPVNKPIVVEL